MSVFVPRYIESPVKEDIQRKMVFIGGTSNPAHAKINMGLGRPIIEE